MSIDKYKVPSCYNCRWTEHFPKSNLTILPLPGFCIIGQVTNLLQLLPSKKRVKRIFYPFTIEVAKS